MSFAEKLGSFMQRPGQENAPRDDIPWWLKYAGRAAGSVGGVFALGFGFFMCLTVTPMCIVTAIWQMIAGFAVLVIEAPCCCFCVEYVTTVSTMADQRPLWMRSAFYVLISLPAMVLCGGFSAYAGSGLIFVTGTLYGFMALGKKASADDMRAQAAVETGTQSDRVSPASAPQQSNISSGMRSALVENAQPMGLTGSPFDSNV